jgi:hypothetical protein
MQNKRKNGDRPDTFHFLLSAKKEFLNRNNQRMHEFQQYQLN